MELNLRYGRAASHCHFQERRGGPNGIQGLSRDLVAVTQADPKQFAASAEYSTDALVLHKLRIIEPKFFQATAVLPNGVEPRLPAPTSFQPEQFELPSVPCELDDFVVAESRDAR